MNQIINNIDNFTKNTMGNLELIIKSCNGNPQKLLPESSYIDENGIIKKTNLNKIIDMHTHTNYSDGELSPYELIKLAIESNIGTLAITDHDTINGIKQVNRSDQLIVESGIDIINGIELSAKCLTGTMHILGYDIDIDNEYLNNKLSEIKNNSSYNIISLLSQIKKDYNILFRSEDIQKLISADHNLNRVDLAKLCIKYGYATDIQDAFNKYLIDANNKIRGERKELTYEECFKLITKSGGIPVLAHPNSLKINDLELLKLIKNMINCGLQGIECYHSSFTREETKKYLEIAREFNLLVSGGSDYHGKNTKPDIELGTGKNNNLKIKSLSLLSKIKR